MDPDCRGENEDQRSKLSGYPENHQGGRLLGVTGNGHAAYLSPDDEIFFAGHDSAGTLQTPPPEFGRASELDLNEFELSVGAFVKQSVAEHGKWQALTSFAVDKIDRSIDIPVDKSDSTT